MRAGSAVKRITGPGDRVRWVSSTLISVRARADPVSFVVHWTVAEVVLIAPEGEMMLVLGATVSTVNATDAVFALPRCPWPQM